MLGPLAILCTLLFPGHGAGLKLEHQDVVVEPLGRTAPLPCKVDSWVSYIHWYHHQEGSAPQRLLYLDMSGSYIKRDLVLKEDKVDAKKGRDSYSCTLSVLKLEKSMQLLHVGRVLLHCLGIPQPCALSRSLSKKFFVSLGAPCLAPSTGSGSLEFPWGQTSAPRILPSGPSTSPLHRTLEAKEPLAPRQAQTQGAVQSGETSLNIIQHTVSKAFGVESVLPNAVATSH